MNRRERREREREQRAGTKDDARMARHREWIRAVLPEVWAAGRAGLEAEGRGAVILDKNGAEMRIVYVSDTAARHTPQLVLAGSDGVHGWPDAVTARMVETYDPAKQIVVIVTAGGQLSAYKVRVESPPPPQ